MRYTWTSENVPFNDGTRKWSKKRQGDHNGDNDSDVKCSDTDILCTGFYQREHFLCCIAALDRCGLLLQMTVDREPGKIGWTDHDAIQDVDLGGTMYY